MANPRAAHRFTADRPPLAAPPGGPLLVHLVINVEHWRFDEAMPRTIITPPHGRETVPDVPNFGWADYGMRAGLPRLLRELADRGLPASASFNASVIDAYPRAAAALRDQGLEFIGHGVHQRALDHAGGEAEVIATALRMIEAFTGRRPRGWLGPGLRETVHTPDLLRAAGVDYVCDWCIDDLPTWLSTAHGPLLALPYSLEINDSIVYAIEKHSSPEMLLRLDNTLRLFEQEIERFGQPRVLAIGLHPHLIAVPHRFGYFREMLDRLQGSRVATFMTGSAIADWYALQCPPAAT